MRDFVVSLLLVLMGCLSGSPFGLADDEKLEDVRAYLKISEDLSTSGQVEYKHIESIKKAGFDMVINLAPADKVRNAMEGFLVTEQGMTYVQIPVSWENPALRDLDLFFDLMEANKDRKVYVHCFANMRVSVFVYLYRTLQLGVSEEEARMDRAKIWDPSTEAQWEKFIEQAQSRSTHRR